ncbi:MAG: DegT/DnrJ/EryC1/StrS family aminotransferase [Armatimonadota bacterium]
MPIPSFDETIEHRRLLPELEAAVRGVLLEEYPDGKSQVAWLEEDIVAFLGGGHAVGVQSGTAALFLTVKALGIGPGDEVIAPPNSDLVTTSIVGHAGATFVLCDVEAETMNINPAAGLPPSGSWAGSFPVAERLGEQVLGLPMYPGMPPENVDEVAHAVLEAVGPHKAGAKE